MAGTPSPGKGQPHYDENIVSTPTAPPLFVDGLAEDPTVKKRRRLRSITESELVNAKEAYDRGKARRAADKLATERATAAEAERHQRADVEARVDGALDDLKARGFNTLHDFWFALLKTNDQQRSSQVTRMLNRNGRELLDGMRKRAPEMAETWATDVVLENVAAESAKLAQCFRPAPCTPISNVLEKFSLADIVERAEQVAPTLCDVLRKASTNERNEGLSRKDNDLILATAVSLLVQSRNEQASEFQTTMCIYLLACGATRSQFEVLNHAGLTLSYSQAVAKLKQLGAERLADVIDIAHRRAFMIIWDNLNIAFRVGEQRHDSKDHFDNGTTATLIPLWGVQYGELALDLKPPQTDRLPTVDFTPCDLLPSAEQAHQVEVSFVWHIENILFDRYPALRERFKDSIGPPPTIDAIPVHKTEQYPLPAMHIDESSLEGTLDVLDTILVKKLNLSAEDIQKHGLILCAGDQLSASLLDKVYACRRDDTDLLENVGRYTEPQLGIFHLKMAAARMTANNSWGKPNDNRVPWSLYKMNDLLGRKKITAGWQAKSLPPFRPIWELMLNLVLPAHLLNALQLQCGMDTLDEWVATVSSRDAITALARRVLKEHCSPRQVSQLRRRPDHDRDVPRENMMLFNHDTILLLELRSAVRRGDVGSILNLLTYWMIMFRGTGKMPKYADALFHTLMRLKSMDPKLRRAFLMNWLANLTGHANAFKEMDLLQEHQNFWAKLIYNARGSNCSWGWLGMVSVSIFVLRDVIRNMQREFKTPHNGKSHTSPSTEKDIQTLLTYLEAQKLQTHTPARENNHLAIPTTDLLSAGAEYANTAGAFKNFRRPVFKTKNHGIAETVTTSEPVVAEPTTVIAESAGTSPGGSGGVDTAEDEYDMLTMDFDLDEFSEVMFDDLALDDEEFPSTMEPHEYVKKIQGVIDELARFE